MSSRVLHSEGRALTFRAKAAWIVARDSVGLLRHWSSRQGCKSGKVEVLFPSTTCIAYPERVEVTKYDMPGRKSLGCPVGDSQRWERSGTMQTQRPEHNEMAASSKTSPRKVAFAERNGKPTHSVLGMADDIEEETGTSTRWDRRSRGPGIWGKICRDRVGKNPLAAGAGSNLQRLSDRGEEP
jgi:hypothetical protein